MAEAHAAAAARHRLERAHAAWRWRVVYGRAGFEAVHKLHGLALDALTGGIESKTRLVRNTCQFIAGRRANNKAADRRRAAPENPAGQGCCRRLPPTACG